MSFSLLPSAIIIRSGRQDSDKIICFHDEPPFFFNLQVLAIFTNQFFIKSYKSNTIPNDGEVFNEQG